MEGLIFWILAGAVLVFMVRRTKRKARETEARHSAQGSTDVRPGVRRVAFDYQDRQGKLTTREVTAQRYRNGKVFAYCHLRRAERSFFVDRIEGPVTDTETGELLDKRAWARTL